MLFQLYYFPCIAFFVKNAKNNPINISVGDKYSKQSYRTRTYILGPNKIETLSIPVHKAILTKDVKIDNKEAWQRNHWRSLETAYNSSPYFEHYDYLFEPLFSKEYTFLNDFNQDCLTTCLKILKSNQSICLKEPTSTNENIHLNAKEREENHPKLKKMPYFQQFGSTFESNLSILDLIFNKGPESLPFINNSR